ncbi:hypothetical protein B0H12DRAFT_1103689 [Mycena haematopus]|nr:hypothetical protein B0H12DRAFT_1103689 [Mycena haematopus]
MAVTTVTLCSGVVMGRRPRDRARVGPHFDHYKGQGPFAPFGAIAATHTGTTRIQRIRRCDYERNPDSAVSQIKVGHTKNFEARKRAYSRCEVDWVLVWEMKLWTPRRMLLGKCD